MDIEETNEGKEKEAVQENKSSMCTSEYTQKLHAWNEYHHQGTTRADSSHEPNSALL